MAMSFAIAGTILEGMVINNPEAMLFKDCLSGCHLAKS